ncbi:MAG: RagB/SusD family nutrient uptake outer membrane protein [Niastella sp.]|uniref:RagB/SusD family nutrient uptake outer membrane protein n=1 Tax=Niastella sp. TaxID=1869183 RepID=UPI00389991C7
MKFALKYILAGLLPVLSLVSCKKFVQLDDPIDQVASSEAFNSDANAATAIRGIYSKMMSAVNLGLGGGIQVQMDASADGLKIQSSTNQFYEYYTNSIGSANTANKNLWNYFYYAIYSANAAIENINASTGMTDAGKRQYTAEAMFLRALNYFYLVNAYGDVPLTTSSNYEYNNRLFRSAKAAVYELIKSDLLYAQANLGPAYQGIYRIRANSYAATALLAKVYLYLEDWANAAQQATTVLNNTTDYTLETDLTKTFLITSKEAILRIEQPGNNAYTWDAYAFVPSTTATVPGFTITDTLVKTFETGDKRKTNWVRTATIATAGVPITYYSPYKYRVNSGTGAPLESHMVLRLGEMYLIRAEARAQGNQLPDAIADLDKVRSRAGLPLVATTNPGISQTDLLATIAHERWVELFAENGDRWMDLKRTGKANSTLQYKPNWQTDAQLFPIPMLDIQTNKNLEQNHGYQ